MCPETTAPEADPGDLSLPQALERAREARMSGALAQAETALRRALDLAPRHVEALNELANVLAARGDRVGAQQIKIEAGDAAIEQAAGMAASLLDTPLQSRAAAVLDRAVRTHPAHPGGALAQAELWRRLGDLPAARQAVGRCLTLDPANARARWLDAALDGRRLPPNAAFMSPAPAWVLEDFLPAAEHRRLLEFALAHDRSLEPSTVGGINPHDNWRRSLVDSNLHKADLSIASRIRAAAIEAVARLQLDPFDFASEEMQFTAHNQGDFYKAHCDWGAGGAEHRRLTFVYYLHRQPRGFIGGGLRLFDSMEAANHYGERAYTRVDPADNRLVMFPSYVWHEVEAVNCASGRYEDGRFTINGWFGVARSAPRIG